MSSIRYKLDKWISKQILKKQMELSQASTVAVGEKKITEGMPQLARQAAADGIVLLENDGVLPLKKGTVLSVFGRCQMDTFYVGYGSGGDVKAPYRVSYLEALLEAEQEKNVCLNHELLEVYRAWRREPDNEPLDGFWGHWPMSYPEMPVSPELARKAAEASDAALVVIGRAAGEDRENQLKPGSYYLTKDEKEMLTSVTGAFEKVIVVMDCGNVVDLSWMDAYPGKIRGLLYAWQGGMETGHGLADVLTGKVNPSAKLTDTISLAYEDQPTAKNFGGKKYNCYVEDIFVGYRYFETFAPEKVRYPFGYGLSYTQFSIAAEEFSYDEKQGMICVSVAVNNTGSAAGREVVQLYAQAPQGKLGKAKRSLCAFGKTKLLAPGESQTMLLSCDEYAISSYDDGGNTGNLSAYVLEAGEYSFYVGNSVRENTEAGRFAIAQTKVIRQFQPVCEVQNPFDRIKAVEKDGRICRTTEPVPVNASHLKERILQNLPEETEEEKGHGEETLQNVPLKFSDVAEGKVSLDAFVAGLSDEELEALSRGYGVMDAPQGTSGNAGTFGGIVPALKERGVPAVSVTDGPAGVRINAYTSLLPCGTALASSWDTDQVQRLYALLGKEMEEHKTDILLGAGMNIHRNPLCGRNFEYFSEDPLLSGKMGAAFTKGIQENPGKGACPKHLACNNQEVRRGTNDSRVSERALREIYLKGFEIMVRESRPLCIMTSYNKINGVWSHYNYDLAATVLRQEWNFDGLVMTDWWMQKSSSPEFPALRDNAYRVRAQVDLLMPGNMDRMAKAYVSDGTLTETLGQPEGMTAAELRRTAKNVLTCILRCRFGQN